MQTAHSSPPDCETRNIVSTSDGVPCAKKERILHFIQTQKETKRTAFKRRENRGKRRYKNN